jgi:hypothetical protein
METAVVVHRRELDKSALGLQACIEGEWPVDRERASAIDPAGKQEVIEPCRLEEGQNIAPHGGPP